MKIVVLSDLHFSKEPNPSLPKRRGELADVLLTRAVRRINRFIRPDLTCVLGDLIDQPASPDADDLYRELRPLLDQLQSPTVVLPGNHDTDPERFYRHFPRPEPAIDLAGFRILSFADPEQPGYNAIRTPDETARMKQLAAGFAGPKITLQHVPLFPAGAAPCPYNYVNSEELVATMASHGIVLALSGHFHAGFAVTAPQRNFITAPALCETPFRFLEIDLDPSGCATVTEHRMRLPEGPALTDCHIHTALAYCSENLSPERTFAVADAVGLAGIVFSEHAGHLYLSREDYHRAAYYPSGLDGCRIVPRMEEYFDLLREWDEYPFRTGLELEPDSTGRPAVRAEDLARVQIRLGAVHYLSQTAEPDRARREFLFLTEGLLRSGVHILAHPFRVFRRSGLTVPPDLYPEVADLLRRYGVAAEINFHTNDPEPEFFRLCVERGVRISFGSDTHNLCEIGDFHPHLRLIESIGHLQDLPELLVRLPS